MMDVRDGNVIWEKKIAGDIAKLGGHLASPPSVIGNHSFIGTTTGEICWYDNKNGNKKWSYNVGQPVRFQPALAEGRIYFGTTHGRLCCIDLEDKEITGWNMWGGSAAHNGPKKPQAIKPDISKTEIPSESRQDYFVNFGFSFVSLIAVILIFLIIIIIIRKYQ